MRQESIKQIHRRRSYQNTIGLNKNINYNDDKIPTRYAISVKKLLDKLKVIENKVEKMLLRSQDNVTSGVSFNDVLILELQEILTLIPSSNQKNQESLALLPGDLEQ
jgi:hypothetical protein